MDREERGGFAGEEWVTSPKQSKNDQKTIPKQSNNNQQTTRKQSQNNQKTIKQQSNINHKAINKQQNIIETQSTNNEAAAVRLPPEQSACASLVASGPPEQSPRESGVGVTQQNNQKTIKTSSCVHCLPTQRLARGSLTFHAGPGPFI